MSRMAAFAELVAKEINHPQVTKEELSIAKSDRFAFYKIGPVLSISVSIDCGRHSDIQFALTTRSYFSCIINNTSVNMPAVQYAS